MFSYEITQDNCIESPREWDNVGTMICFHERYQLGDKHDLKSSMFNGWDELRDYLEKERNAINITPLYLYDHGGITMKTGRFGCPWDSGQVGFIFTTKEMIDKEGIKPERIQDILEGEVEVYNQFIEGDVWDVVIKDDEGGFVDQCGGFYGYSYAEEEAQRMVECAERYAKEKFGLAMTTVEKEVGPYLEELYG